MTKSATDVMQEIVASAVLDAIAALKSASKGLPNQLLRDVGAIHANSTFEDLPAEVQAAVAASVRSAFNRLLREGYSVSPAQPGAARAAAAERRPHPGGAGRPQRPGGGGRPPRPGGGRPPRPGGSKPTGPRRKD
jgi:hypothetical protein